MAIADFPLNNTTPVTIDFILAEKARKILGISESKIKCDVLPLPVSVRSVTFVLKNGIDGEIFPKNRQGQRNFIINTHYREYALVSDNHIPSDNNDRFHVDQILSTDTGKVSDIDEDIFIY